MSKSAVMVFSKDALNGCWKWGEYSLVYSYSYIGIDFSSNGAWDMHNIIKKLLDNCRKNVNQL